MNNDDKLKRYAELKVQERAIQAEIKALGEEVLAVVSAEERPIIVQGLGSFSVAKLNRWTYPEDVVELEERLKSAQKVAQQTGRATTAVTLSLRFRSLASDDDGV